MAVALHHGLPFESSVWLVGGLFFGGIVGRYSRFAEPIHQCRAGSIFRDTNPQLVRPNPGRSRHRLGKAFVLG